MLPRERSPRASRSSRSVPRLRLASLQSFLPPCPPPPAQPRSEPKQTSAHRLCPRAPVPAQAGRHSRPRPPQPEFRDAAARDTGVRTDELLPPPARQLPEYFRPPAPRTRPEFRLRSCLRPLTPVPQRRMPWFQRLPPRAQPRTPAPQLPSSLPPQPPELPLRSLLLQSFLPQPLPPEAQSSRPLESVHRASRLMR